MVTTLVAPTLLNDHKHYHENWNMTLYLIPYIDGESLNVIWIDIQSIIMSRDG